MTADPQPSPNATRPERTADGPAELIWELGPRPPGREPASAEVVLAVALISSAADRPGVYSTSGGSSSDALMCSDRAVAAARSAASCCRSSLALESAAA